MKIWTIGGRIGVGTLVLICLLLFSALSFAGDDDDSATVWYATSLSGSGANSLDGAVSGVSIGPKDTAIVAESGTSRLYLYMAIFSDPAEDSPDIILPDDIGAGVTAWKLAKIYIDAIEIEGNAAVTGYISGKIPPTDVKTGTVTLSGVSQRGGIVTNMYASSEVTCIAAAATKGDSVIAYLVNDMTSGSTLWFQINSADKILNYSSFAAGTGAGTSYYYLSSSSTSGTTGEGISLISPADGFWIVYESGSPSVGSK